MNDTLKQLKDNQITPKEAISLINSHSTRLSDIYVNLNQKPLKCGLSAFENHEYLLENEGNLVIMAARPGNGKTALACQIGLNVAQHKRVLMFSLEMKKESLRKRLLSVLSQVPIKKLGFPQYDKRVKEAQQLQESYQFDIVDKSDLDINTIISIINDEQRKSPIGLIIIDYLGVIAVNNEFRATSIGNIAKRIKKEVADRLQIPVIALAQMNRGFDSRVSQSNEETETRPVLADIGESSGIEHAADVVMFLHRPYLVNKHSSPGLFKVYVCKNRNGEVKDFDLEFSQELTKFFDVKTHNTDF